MPCVLYTRIPLATDSVRYCTFGQLESRTTHLIQSLRGCQSFSCKFVSCFVGDDVELTRRSLYVDAPGETAPVVPGSFGAQLVEGLEPAQHEQTIIKKRFSAFFQTHLDMVLRRYVLNACTTLHLMHTQPCSHTGWETVIMVAAHNMVGMCSLCPHSSDCILYRVSPLQESCYFSLVTEHLAWMCQ